MDTGIPTAIATDGTMAIGRARPTPERNGLPLAMTASAGSKATGKGSAAASATTTAGIATVTATGAEITIGITTTGRPGLRLTTRSGGARTRAAALRRARNGRYM